MSVRKLMKTKRKILMQFSVEIKAKSLILMYLEFKCLAEIIDC